RGDRTRRLVFLTLWNWYLDADVVPGRVVVKEAALVVLPVRAETVEPKAVRGRLVDERLAGEEVVGDRVQVLGGQGVECLRVRSVLAPVTGQSQSDLEIATPLLDPVVRLLDLADRGRQECDQDIADGLAAALGRRVDAEGVVSFLRGVEAGLLELGKLRLESIEFRQPFAPVVVPQGRRHLVNSVIHVSQSPIPINFRVRR